MAVTREEVIDFLSDILYKAVKHPNKEVCAAILEDMNHEYLEDLILEAKDLAIKRLRS